MASAALGSKRVCVSCAVRFYDLTRAPAVCPKCGTEQPIDVPRVARPVRGMMADRRFRTGPRPPAAVAEAEPEEAAEVAEAEDEDEGDDEDAAEEDAGLLEEDEDERAPVPEH